MTSIWPIIPALFLVLLASYYSQNYAGILASPLSTGTSKVDKLLKMPPDSISEDVIFQYFPGGMPPDPLVLSFSHYECKYAS